METGCYIIIFSGNIDGDWRWGGDGRWRWVVEMGSGGRWWRWGVGVEMGRWGVEMGGGDEEWKQGVEMGMVNEMGHSVEKDLGVETGEWRHGW